MRRVITAASVVAMFAVFAELHAQSPSLSASVTRCLDKLSAKEMNWSPVHLDAIVFDQRFQSSANLLVARIASRVRARFGAADGGTPSLDSMLLWRDLSPDMMVFAFRDGTIRWQIDTTSERLLLSRSRSQSAAWRLLDSALFEIAQSREGLVWPTGNVPEMAAMRLVFRYGRTDREGNLHVVPGGTQIFSLMVPWEQAGELKVVKRANYPTRALNAGVRGEILVRFRVNEDGRAEYVRDIPPQEIPPKLSEAYRDLADEFMRSVKGSTFEPRRVGGCAVPHYSSLRYSLPVLPSGQVRR